MYIICNQAQQLLTNDKVSDEAKCEFIKLVYSMSVIIKTETEEKSWKDSQLLLLNLIAQLTPIKQIK